jgi:hypothetical protein
LHSRVVIVVDENGTITHTEQVTEIADEPITKLLSGTLIVFNGISKKTILFLRKIKSFRYAIAGALKLITTEHSIMVQCSLE